MRGERRSGIAGAGLALLALGPVALLPLGATAADQPGFSHGRLDDRSYRLYVPKGAADAEARRPLVVALHGCWQTPDDFARGTRLNDAADERGLVVLYPAQDRRANASRCWNWYEPPQRDRGETASVLGVVRAVAGRPDVASDRVVVLGLSAGGFMAVNLVCTAPEVFAGVGVAAGGPFGCATGLEGAVECMRGRKGSGEAGAAACRAQMGSRARPLRASLWQGDADSVVGEQNLDALAEMFRRLGGLGAPAVDRRDGAVHSVWRDARGRPSLESWLVPGMGHAWSGGSPRALNTYPAGPSATSRMLDFLLGPPVKAPAPPDPAAPATVPERVPPRPGQPGGR